MRKQTVTWVFCLLGISLLGSSASAQDLAVIPYRHIIKMAQGENKNPDAKEYRMKISSSLVDVPPEKIELLLDTKESPIHLLVDDKGFFDIPNSSELFEQNPFVIANQPRGTLNLSFKIEVEKGFVPPKIVGGKIRYNKLFESVLEVQNEVRKVDPVFGLMGKGQLALKIITDQPIRIEREMGEGPKKIKGARTYRPKNGIIYLFMEAYMFEDDPIVEIPGDVKFELRQFPSDIAEKIKASY